jgi:hypothetical protein
MQQLNMVAKHNRGSTTRNMANAAWFSTASIAEDLYGIHIHSCLLFNPKAWFEPHARRYFAGQGCKVWRQYLYSPSSVAMGFASQDTICGLV